LLEVLTSALLALTDGVGSPQSLPLLKVERPCFRDAGIVSVVTEADIRHMPRLSRTARQYSIGVMPVAFANRRRNVRLSSPAAAAIKVRDCLGHP
jgi:hypothetical protein